MMTGTKQLNLKKLRIQRTTNHKQSNQAGCSALLTNGRGTTSDRRFSLQPPVSAVASRNFIIYWSIQVKLPEENNFAPRKFEPVFILTVPVHLQNTKSQNPPVSGN